MRTMSLRRKPSATQVERISALRCHEMKRRGRPRPGRRPTPPSRPWSAYRNYLFQWMGGCSPKNGLTRVTESYVIRSSIITVCRARTSSLRAFLCPAQSAAASARRFAQRMTSHAIVDEASPPETVAPRSCKTIVRGLSPNDRRPGVEGFTRTERRTRAHGLLPHRLRFHCYSLLFGGGVSPKAPQNGPRREKLIVFHCY